MNKQLSSDEREERLKQIRGRYEHGLTTSVDVGFLLSLLDSQAIETFVGPCTHCGHNNYNAEQK